MASSSAALRCASLTAGPYLPETRRIVAEAVARNDSAANPITDDAIEQEVRRIKHALDAAFPSQAEAVPFYESAEWNKFPIAEAFRKFLLPSYGDLAVRATAVVPSSAPPLSHRGLRAVEIGSGSGQHGMYLSSAFPGFFREWQCTDIAPELPTVARGITALKAAVFPSVTTHFPAPCVLDGGAWSPRPAWVGGDPFDVVYTANTLHIMPWSAAKTVLREIVPTLLGLSTPPRSESVGSAGRGGREHDSDNKPSSMPPSMKRLVVYGPFNYHGCFTTASNQRFDGWLQQRSAALSGVRDVEAVIEAAAAAGLTQLEHDVAMPDNNRLLVFSNGGSAAVGGGVTGSAPPPTTS